MKSTIPHTTPGRTGDASASPRRGSGHRVASSSGKPLSTRQKAVISQTARQAFDIQDRAGLIDGSAVSDSKRFETWRRAQQAEAIGISSLRECGNNHYRPLMAHFLVLAGKDDSAFRLAVRTGRVKDHGAIEDTHENRETQRALIMQALVDHSHRCDALHKDYDADIAAKVEAAGGIITPGYVIAIAKNKCKGRGLDSLTARELSQIHWTITNRIAAKEGRGTPASRNKSQRRSAKTKRTP